MTFSSRSMPDRTGPSWIKPRPRSGERRPELKRIVLQLTYKKKLKVKQVISASEIALTESDVVEAEAALRAAKADRDLANLNFDAAQVRAPSPARSAGSVLDAGSVVTADSTRLAIIVAVDPIHVVFGLPKTSPCG